MKVANVRYLYGFIDQGLGLLCLEYRLWMWIRARSVSKNADKFCDVLCFVIVSRYSLPDTCIEANLAYLTFWRIPGPTLSPLTPLMIYLTTVFQQVWTCPRSWVLLSLIWRYFSSTIKVPLAVARTCRSFAYSFTVSRSAIFKRPAASR